MIPGLGASLAQLEYPPEKIQMVLIDDGSRDGTRVAMELLAPQLPRARVLTLQANMGKAHALNTALIQFPFR
jgi:glycosyltransferase involved in cell wall biosynthesis